MVADADGMRDRDPKRARKLYEQVEREVDTQFPDIEERIQRARTAERARRGPSKAKAVLGWTLGLAVAGALAYVAVENDPNKGH